VPVYNHKLKTIKNFPALTLCSLIPWTVNTLLNVTTHLQITGGAGFVGSHLVDALMKSGHEVTVVDNFFTGRKKNVEHWIGHTNFELINHDVVTPIFLEGETNVICYSGFSPRATLGVNDLKLMEMHALLIPITEY